MITEQDLIGRTLLKKDLYLLMKQSSIPTSMSMTKSAMYKAIVEHLQKQHSGRMSNSRMSSEHGRMPSVQVPPSIRNLPSVQVPPSIRNAPSFRGKSTRIPKERVILERPNISPNELYVGTVIVHAGNKWTVVRKNGIKVWKQMIVGPNISCPIGSLPIGTLVPKAQKGTYWKIVMENGHKKWKFSRG